MRIAIIHYHLKRGGVTRVIESTLGGFDAAPQNLECVVLAGEVPTDFRYVDRARAVEGLRYSNAQTNTPAAASLKQALQDAAREALGGDPDLWHIHNHSLGKNAAMPGVVALLAQEGAALLLHMHDFAEDGRPGNFLLNQERLESASRLYPKSARIHYGLLNARDTTIFAEAGFPKDRLHLLPNPVEAHSEATSEPAPQILRALDADRLMVYPVRAVRRKNFGEMLLWASVAPPGWAFATTLGPTNQNYLAAYRDWTDFAGRHGLPVHFGIGERFEWSFEEIMRSAHAILSTSIAEGFGLAYLEPWLFGKSILGRDLPEITCDFKENGVSLPGLYPCLPIPTDWVDLAKLRSAIETGLSGAYAAYGRELPADAVDRALAAIQPSKEHIDFAGLNEPLQKEVIARLCSDPTAKKQLPELGDVAPVETIDGNREKIAAQYSLETYTARLISLYQTILANSQAEAPAFYDPNRVLDGFLQPERFRLLRT